MQLASVSDTMNTWAGNSPLIASKVLRMASPNIELDNSKFEVIESFAVAEVRDRNYWLAKTPIERLAACKLLRQ
jgi:hypothetical protein